MEESITALETEDNTNNVNQPQLVKTEPVADTFKSKNENCCDRFLGCLSHVPCPSLIAWIILLMGLGGLTGSLLLGAQKTRLLFDDEEFLWPLEYVLTGVVVATFVFGTLFLTVAHLSTDPTSRYIFSTSKKNLCARGLNIVVLLIAYCLAILWILAGIFLSFPLILTLLVTLLHDYGNLNCIDLQYYALPKRLLCGIEYDSFVDESRDVLICYAIAVASTVILTISMIHFLISISANYTHLKDDRFSTLNAYEAEEVRNSKHSVVDTSM